MQTQRRETNLYFGKPQVQQVQQVTDKKVHKSNRKHTTETKLLANSTLQQTAKDN